MSNAQLKTVVGQSVATLEKDPTTFPGMLKAFKGEIERALPRHINADRMCRIALTCFRMTPKLGECAPASVFAALIKASQLGLEPGLNGRAYLIPYGGECQFVPGWKGLVELVNRTGRAACWTGAVFHGDDFDYQLGDTPYVKHRPQGEDDPKKLTHTYAVGRVRGNDWPVIETWPTAKIEKHRDRYNKVGKKHYSYENWEMYARKVPLLQVLKYLPSSPELEVAMALNDTFESGERQGLTIEGAISNAFEPPAAPPKNDEQSEPTITYAKLMEAINKAENTDALDGAVDLIRSIAEEQQRAELDVAAKKRRKELEK